MTIPRTSFLLRIMKYCADSERCTHDVLTKLEAWGVLDDEKEDILMKLYAEKFVDDHRYARTYVTGKWNLDRWGKIKIANSLRQKKIDEKIIVTSLNYIDDEEYVLQLRQLIRKKLKEVKSGTNIEIAKRVFTFAVSRGFEEEMVQEWIEKEGMEGMPDAGFQTPDS